MTTAATVLAVIGLAGFRSFVDKDAREITPAGNPPPGEIVAQREDGAIVVLGTETGEELRELVPAGQVDVVAPSNFTVSPDGEFLYFVRAPFGEGDTFSSVIGESGGEPTSGVDLEILMAVDATEDEVAAVQQQLEDDPDVADAELVDQQQAYDEFRQAFPDDPGLVGSVDPSDFPVTFRGTAVDPGRAGALSDRYASRAGVDSVATNSGTASETDVPAVVRIPIEGGDVERVASGLGVSISPDGRRLATVSPRVEGPDQNGDVLVVRDLESGEERELAPRDSSSAIAPYGWAADSEHFAYELRSITSGSFGESTEPVAENPTPLEVALLVDDVVSGDDVLDGDSVAKPESASVLPMWGAGGQVLGLDLRGADLSETQTTFAVLDLLSGNREELGTVDLGAVPLDVDRSGDNVLFTGVRGSSLEDLFRPTQGGREPGAFVGYLDDDGEVHEISGDVVTARWVPGTELEPERQPQAEEAAPPMPAEVVVEHTDGSIAVHDSTSGEEVRTLVEDASSITSPALAVSPNGHDVFYEAIRVDGPPDSGTQGPSADSSVTPSGIVQCGDIYRIPAAAPRHRSTSPAGRVRS